MRGTGGPIRAAADLVVEPVSGRPYCVFARDAVRLLHASGRAARQLDGGMLE